MGTTPGFFNIPRHGVKALYAATETDLAIPVNSVAILAAGANGTKIDRIVITLSTSTLTVSTIPGFVFLFTYNATTNFSLYDTLPVMPKEGRIDKSYTDEDFLLVSGETLYASQATVGGTTPNSLWIHAFGADA